MTQLTHGSLEPETSAEGLASSSESLNLTESVASVGYGAPPISACLPAEAGSEDCASPQQRIAALLKEMPGQARTLSGVLAFCETKQLVADVDAHVAKLQENNRSVFTSPALCRLLKRAGALERVTADGAPFEEADTSPETVLVDGVECLAPRKAPALYWVTTAEGLEALGIGDSTAAMEELLEKEALYLPIYKHILEACAAESGASTRDLRVELDAQPLLQRPRLFTQHFMGLLEERGAVEWAGCWKTTELGRSCLEGLAGVGGIEDVRAELLPEPEIDEVVFA